MFYTIANPQIPDAAQRQFDGQVTAALQVAAFPVDNYCWYVAYFSPHPASTWDHALPGSLPAASSQ